MKITGIKTGIMSAGLKKPFKTALRTVERLQTLVLILETDEGLTGYGEAPPTGPITGESTGSIRSAIHEYIFPRIKGIEVRNLEELRSAIEHSCKVNTSAKAAVDIAVHDLFGQVCGFPLYQFFGGLRSEIETDLTISVNSPEEMVKDSLEAVNDGFRTLKIKVGKTPELDIIRIRAIRQAVGSAVQIRVDANQGWNAKEAVRILRRLEDADLNIELVEQPVPASDFEGMKTVTKNVSIPVLADESVFSATDAVRLITEGACDLINIKLMKTGGFTGALRICSIAEAYGVECMLGCMLESKLSVTAAAHLACGKKCFTRFDLDSPCLCSEDPVSGGLLVSGPLLKIESGNGLGISGLSQVVWD